MLSEGENGGIGGVDRLEARRRGLDSKGEGCNRDSGVRRFGFEDLRFEVIWVDPRGGIQ